MLRAQNLAGAGIVWAETGTARCYELLQGGLNAAPTGLFSLDFASTAETLSANAKITIPPN